MSLVAKRLALGLLAALALAGCASSPPAEQAASATRSVAAATSPTTVELASPTPSPTAAATAVETAAPTASPTAEPAPTSAVPTRVVPPAESITLPPGFGVSVFASGLQAPRMMALGPDGDIYVAERRAGRVVRLLDLDKDGVADDVAVVASGLTSPNSLAFYEDGSLYVGEVQRVLRLHDRADDGAFAQREVIVDGLPEGGHNTRSVRFSPDWSTLFVSVGSSCNVCDEADERRAAIVAYNPDGSGERIYARGLRNAVGLSFRPGSAELWATNNGRDHMGDDLPPETVNVVSEGDDFGWPRCHAGDIADPQFGGPDACAGVKAPAVEMQAHSAPLGLAFYTGQQFPEDYSGDLFVAFHGSWNRSVPTGYKVVRVPMQGEQPGPVEDFASGWLRPDGTSWGRPVDVLVGPDGSLYVSDDQEGIIYRIYYTGGS